MINKLDITKFGLFNDYSWDRSIGRAETFRKLNIIYGRNYSGKTTLSRILKCVENKQLHRHYHDANFSLNFVDGSTSSNNLLESNYQIRVYNSDFVRENLSWLYKSDGTIEPFTILGSKNVELENKLKEIKEKLGSIQEKIGLISELDNARENHTSKLKIMTDAETALENKLKTHANNTIKPNSNLFIITSSKRTYNISDIRQEIATIKSSSLQPLSEATREDLLKLLKEVSMQDVDLFKEAKPHFSAYHDKAKDLLEKKIKPSEPIQDLVNDNLLQEWVRHGIEKHKNIKEDCAFCGGKLRADLWDRLDAHFSKESEDLRKEIEQVIGTLQKAKSALSTFITINRDSFYDTLKPQYDKLYKDWITSENQYGENIQTLIDALEIRQKDIFNEINLPAIDDVSDKIYDILVTLNSLIGEHNKKTLSLSSDQSSAREKLRFSDISQFMKDIDFDGEEEKILGYKGNADKEKLNVDRLKKEVDDLLAEKTQIENQSKDESRGSQLINEHLSHYFGHNELNLSPEEIGSTENEGKQIKFKILRNGSAANNLSEGECSLISFCYFIAKIEDELKDDILSKKLIIYIDDPISSLDNNHIFFMYSLIETIIAKPKRYCQLFISTHNLDFLKYLKRITTDTFKPQLDSKPKPDVRYFMIERKSRTGTFLIQAPKHLKTYVTEFNFLFSQIYQCAEIGPIMQDETRQYSFGNNLRKFLEAYLFYKYPTNKISDSEKLKKFFDGDMVSINLIGRIANEYSHIEERFERGMVPVDVDEIKKIAQLVLTRINTLDPEQYAALVQSIEN